MKKQKIVLKGIGASSGRATGHVKIILKPSENYKVKNKNILVTVMTNPLFIPAMQKAGAIVTDVGGLLSHAAIISRELGIPCVVGTKNATKILKNNDKVIVDGTKGIVYKNG